MWGEDVSLVRGKGERETKESKNSYSRHSHYKVSTTWLSISLQLKHHPEKVGRWAIKGWEAILLPWIAAVLHDSQIRCIVSWHGEITCFSDIYLLAITYKYGLLRRDCMLTLPITLKSEDHYMIDTAPKSQELAVPFQKPRNIYVRSPPGQSTETSLGRRISQCTKRL